MADINLHVSICPDCARELLLALQAMMEPGPPEVRHINAAGLQIIKDSEGCRLRAYKCPAGVWTIGYGHTKGVQAGDSCTQRQADEWLVVDCQVAERAVDRLVTAPLTDNQFSALVSWTFNLGEGNLAKSTMLKRINEGKMDAVPGEMKKWVHAGTTELTGLVTRRAKEAALWAA